MTQIDSARTRSGRYFHLFIPRVEDAPGLPLSPPKGSKQVSAAEVEGTLYEVEGTGPVLVLAGNSRIVGDIWRCPVEGLKALDADEWVRTRRLRRVGVQVGEYPCWVFVAGPRFARELAQQNRSRASEARAG